jgi:hypothetical protein
MTAYHRVMNVRGPDGREKEQKDMCEIVHRDEGESDDVGGGLTHRDQDKKQHRISKCLIERYILLPVEFHQKG